IIGEAPRAAEDAREARVLVDLSPQPQPLGISLPERGADRREAHEDDQPAVPEGQGLEAVPEYDQERRGDEARAHEELGAALVEMHALALGMGAIRVIGRLAADPVLQR